MREQEAIKIGDPGTFYPFGKIKQLKFPPEYYDGFYDDIEDFDNPSLVVTSSRLVFGISSGGFCAIPVNLPDGFQPRTDPPIDTPLGRVRFLRERSYRSGRQVNSRILEAPLTFAVFINHGSMEDYLALCDYTLVINVGRRKYFLDCISPWHEPEIELTTLAYEGVPKTLYSDILLNLRRETREVLIPGRPSLLAQVGISFRYNPSQNPG